MHLFVPKGPSCFGEIHLHLSFAPIQGFQRLRSQSTDELVDDVAEESSNFPLLGILQSHVSLP